MPTPSWFDPTRLHSGGDWLFSDEVEADPVWGHGDEILWHTGEPLMIAAPTGAGKTTTAIQLVFGLMGLSTPYLFGYRINTVAERVLYLAMDRPNQARRAMLRLAKPSDRDELNERLVVWRGPPPQDMARNPAVVPELCEEAKADVVIIDSLKDGALRLSDDEAGGAIARCIGLTIAEDIEVLILHHQRKQQGDSKPNKIDDVYGSSLITNAMGSVILFWGEPGAPFVEMTHLKQPAGVVGPFTIEHDHLAGTSRVIKGHIDVEGLLTPTGISSTDAARIVYNVEIPTDTQRKNVKRKLDALVKAKKASKMEGTVTPDGRQADRYRLRPVDNR